MKFEHLKLVALVIWAFVLVFLLSVVLEGMEMSRNMAIGFYQERDTILSWTVLTFAGMWVCTAHCAWRLIVNLYKLGVSK